MPGFCKYCSGEVEWQDNVGRRPFCRDCADEIADGNDLRAKYDTDTGEPL